MRLVSRKSMREKQFYSYLSTVLSSDHRRREISIKTYTCDLCDDVIAGLPDDFESKIDIINEIDNSFESDYDKQEPKLLLCLFCQEEFNIPSWV